MTGEVPPMDAHPTPDGSDRGPVMGARRSMRDEPPETAGRSCMLALAWEALHAPEQDALAAGRALADLVLQASDKSQRR
jgi:hypothetical protein